MSSKTARILQSVGIMTFLVCCGTALNTMGDTARQDEAAAATERAHESVATGKFVHSIVLPHDEPLFPPGPGRQEFVTGCVVCHSPRYITMQPMFSRSRWHSEVNKMKNVYGAHISDSQAARITTFAAIRRYDH